MNETIPLLMAAAPPLPGPGGAREHPWRRIWQVGVGLALEVLASDQLLLQFAPQLAGSRTPCKRKIGVQLSFSRLNLAHKAEITLIYFMLLRASSLLPAALAASARP